MICVVATLKVKEGSEEAFVAVAKELVEAVNANEPGCSLYQLHQGPDAQTFVMVERYDDEAAIEAHRNTDHFKQVGARMGPHMAGRPDVAVYPQIS